MKKQLHFKFWFLFLIVTALGTKTSWSQATDTTGFFNPALTGRHLVYFEVVLVDADEDGNYDASITLSQDTVIAWGDYSTSLAFYDEGFLVRDGGGFTSTNTIIPVPGEVIKVWIGVNVPAKTYKTYVQLGDMTEPELVLEGNAAFRNDAIEALNRWSALHNPNAEPDYVIVNEVRLETNSDPSLKSLTTNTGELDPEFDPQTLDYELIVPFGTTSVDIDAVANGLGAEVVYLDGFGDTISTDGVIPFVGEGIDVDVRVTALDGTEASYYVAIFLGPETASADLSEIQLSAGYLTPEFTVDTLNYTAIVPLGTTEVEVTGVPEWQGASVTGGGAVAITDGTGSTSISVTSEDGNTTKTYNIDIYESKVGPGNEYFIRQEISGLVVGETGVNTNIQLFEAIKDMPSQLFTIVETDSAGQYYLKNRNSNYVSHSTANTWNLIVIDSITPNPDSVAFVLNEFEPGRFLISSVVKSGDRRFWASDNITSGSSIYSDKAANNANGIWNILPQFEVVDPFDVYLSDLAVDQGSLKPEFSLADTAYFVTLPEGTTSITVSAVPRDATSTVTGTGTVDVTDGFGVITLTVTASDPNYTQDYTVQYVTEKALALKHSYTFADGTAEDVVGDADGNIVGGSITEGVYTSAADGEYIELPAEEIALNTYPSFTMEAYVTHGVNDGFAMLAYFGGLEGANAAWMQLARQDSISRGQLGTGGAVTQVNGAEPAAGESHHYVFTVSNEEMIWYIDGNPVDTTELLPNTVIGKISTENAWLGESGWNDPSWLGDLHEFNIYVGVMSPDDILDRFLLWPTDDATTDATLSALMLDGDTIDGFAPYTLEYNVIIEEGVTTAPAVTVTTTNANASAVVTDATSVPGSATVVVTAEDGSTVNTYTVNFDYVTGIRDVIESSIKVYPTISNGSFTVQTRMSSSEISVYDFAGRLISTKVSTSTSEEISVPQKGMYLVKVDTEGVSKVFKVFKTN